MCCQASLPITKYEMKLDKKFCHYKRAQRVLSSLGIAGEKLIGKKESKFIAVTVYYSPD